MKKEYPYWVQQRKFCVLCENEVDDFLPWQPKSGTEFVRHFNIIGSDANNFSCPHCGSHDRERHLYMFMKRLGLLDRLEGKKVMIVAPESVFFRKIYNPEINFICGDINPEQYDNLYNPIYKIDLTSIDFDDNSIDLIIANHILEHIPDYQKALSEIMRILKKGGSAILQTPFAISIYDNFEDRLIDTDILREKYYGQNDHVRLFGLRLFDDIRQSGFDLQLYRHDEIMPECSASLYGVNIKENFILARN